MIVVCCVSFVVVRCLLFVVFVVVRLSVCYLMCGVSCLLVVVSCLFVVGC